MTTPLTPRGGTIAGGVVLLLLATTLAVIVLLGAWSWSAIIWLVVLFGGLLVVAGIIGGIARAVARPRTDPAVGDATAAPSPTASTDRLTPDSTDAPLP
jgi:hypothetical protein